MPQGFDVFLSHNSRDKVTIRKVKALLQQRNITVWLDEDELQPGLNWVPLLENAINECQSAAAFVCSNGLGPWEKEEIQALLIRAVNNKIPVIPVLLPGDYPVPELPLFLSNRTYIDMRPGFTAELIDRLYWGITGQKTDTQPISIRKIISDRLPIVKGEFFGRQTELKILNEAWAGNNTHILQFIANGGTGKTKLLRHWLDHTTNIDVLLAWSFCSQGSSEDKQISATPFFNHAFERLEVTPRSFSSEEDKGDYLAKLLSDQRSVLVLDGLEPLQHVGKGMRGELKDKAISQLLSSLVRQEQCLCIISTRLAVHELSDRRHVHSIHLENLSVNDGKELLRSLKVIGKDSDVEAAVKEYGCHALALTLLGNALHTWLDGDVQRRDTLEELHDDEDNVSRHAFKVMQAYSHWLKDTIELRLLNILGLFAHPIDRKVLQVLWQENIPNLTAGVAERAWQRAYKALLDDHHMLSLHDDQPQIFDCHPLIREYFGKQLQKAHPQAWQQAHTRLYEYYKNLPTKHLPDELEEMRPLFSAVAHGCAVDLHQRVFDEVYWPRVHREREYFIFRKLGAFSDDVSTLANFFHPPWRKLSTALSPEIHAIMYSGASFVLRTLGRLSEALEPSKEHIAVATKQENWIEVAIGFRQRSELLLSLGRLDEAVTCGVESVRHAQMTPEQIMKLCLSQVALADALHQAGDSQKALKIFEAAEQLQSEVEPEYPKLYSVQGFKYCDLLLTQGENSQVLERGEYALQIPASHHYQGNLSNALYRLLLGRAYAAIQDFQRSSDLLNLAVDGLHTSGYRNYLPLGLLARASINSNLQNPNHDFPNAQKDLQEVLNIAKPSDMRLYLTDYHLGMSRLLLAELAQLNITPATPVKILNGICEHVDNASQLMQATSYRRRQAELNQLQRQLATLSN